MSVAAPPLVPHRTETARVLSSGRLKRVLGVFISILLVALSATTLALVQHIFSGVRPAVRADLTWRAQRGAAELAQRIELEVAVRDPALILKALEDYRQSTDVLAIVVEDAAGVRLAAHGTMPDGFSFAQPPGAVTQSAEWLSVWQPVLIEGKPIGRLAIFISTARLQAGEHLRRLMLAFVALACLLALYASRFFVTRYLGPVIQLTERTLADLRQLNGTLTIAKEEAESASRAKSFFLANMSHELRTPLNAVMGFPQLMLEGEMGPLLPDQRECLETVLSSSRHLLRLINDVLDLSKVESGKFDFCPELVQLRPLIGEVVSALGSAATRGGLEIRTEIDGALGPVVLDEARLKQVLYNYASNAIKFSPPGKAVVIRARAELADSFRLEVEDCGIGIAAADLDHLFIAFHQLDGGMDKRYQGSGLGLALTKRLVEAQGGSVGVRSVPGAGSVFHAVLPRRMPVPVPFNKRVRM